MKEEEKKAIEDMNRFANGIDMSCVTARQMQIILNLIEEKKICINILDGELKERNKTINEKEIIIEKLQKENEKLKNKLLDTLEGQKVIKEETPQYIKENYIPIEKVKDRIEKYKKLSDKFYVKFLESDRYNTDIREKGIKCDAIILALEELIEEREEK